MVTPFVSCPVSALSTTVMVRVPRGFVELVLWPEFSDLDKALSAYLHEVTLRVIREEVYSDTSDAQEVPEALPSH
jgi:tRNA nucleotidyltransferase (CCA-adding enzyme)